MNQTKETLNAENILIRLNQGDYKAFLSFQDSIKQKYPHLNDPSQILMRAAFELMKIDIKIEDIALVKLLDLAINPPRDKDNYPEFLEDYDLQTASTMFISSLQMAFVLNKNKVSCTNTADMEALIISHKDEIRILDNTPISEEEKQELIHECQENIRGLEHELEKYQTAIEALNQKNIQQPDEMTIGINNSLIKRAARKNQGTSY